MNLERKTGMQIFRKAWIIPGTEDLRPYIPTKTKITKWVGTCIGYPVLAAAMSGIMQLIG